MNETKQTPAPIVDAPEEARSQVAAVRPGASSVRPAGQGLFASGLFGSIAAFLAACSGSEFVSTGKNAQRQRGTGVDGNDGVDAGPADSGSDGGDSGIDSGQDGGSDSDGGQDSGVDPGGVDSGSGGGGKLDGGEDSDSCHANTTNTLKLAEVPEAPAELKPTVKFYGRDNSAMVALKFAGMPDIKHVIICREDGKLIALHGISGADKGAAAFRPIIIDHVNLSGAAKIKIVIVAGDKSYQLTEAKAYFTTYNNLPVVDLSGGAVPAGMMNNQSVGQFDSNSATYNVDNTVSYPSDAANGNQTRNLHTVKSTTTWTPTALVKGTVTDIMGEPISLSGSALTEYQCFCTYSMPGDGKAYRTIIRLG